MIELSIFSNNPILFLLMLGVLALIIGSFLNVVIYRLPIILDYSLLGSQQPPAENPNLSLYLPPSHCPQCKQSIKIRYNIPLLSYLMLGGRCETCNTEISIRYPIVETITLLLSLLVAVKLGPDWKTAAGLILTWMLISLAFIDVENLLLPDELTLPLLWGGLLLSLAGLFTTPSLSVAGAAVGYLIFWTLNYVFLLITKKQGMGYGDMKLSAALGAWFGLEALPFIILTASLVGLLVSLILLLIKKLQHGEQICFGPYLCLAGWLCLIFDYKLIWSPVLGGSLY